LLTGDSSVFTTTSNDRIAFDSKAVRAAKAQFTLAVTTPPWKEYRPRHLDIEPARRSSPRRRSSTRRAAPSDTLPDDIKTSFTAYKALEKLRVLAEAATVKTATGRAARRAEKAFAKGLADLQGYLTTAPSDMVGTWPSASPAPSPVERSPPRAYETKGKGLVKNCAPTRSRT
jgi:hypothetical protein